jgi:integrating conjugative element protein (TIGR03759 family)
MRRATILLLLTLYAAVVHSQTKTSTTSTQATPTQVDSVERSAAQQWGLTLEDYRRYQALMKGVRGAISDLRISPIEVLGIHARDDAERRKYAEMFARLMAEDTQRVLQFQLEYDRAFKRLHPKLVALDFGAGPRRPDGLQAVLAAAPTLPVPASPSVPTTAGMSRAPSVSAGDRILVFTRDDCRDCDHLVQRTVTLARQGVGVDLYMVGARSADEAQRYARRLAIDPTLVSDRRVTLNVDGGTFARVLPQQRGVPALVRKRGDSLVQLALSDLQWEL